MALIKADLDQIEITEYYLKDQYENVMNRCRAINYNLNSMSRWRSLEHKLIQTKCSIGMKLIMREAKKIETQATYLNAYKDNMKSAQSVMLSLLKYMG